MGAPRDPELDFVLAMAVDIHDTDLLCPACGGYAADCQGDAEGEFVVDDNTICYASAARQSWEKEAGEHVEPGTLIRLVDLRREKAPSRNQFDPHRQPTVPARMPVENTI